MAQAIIDALVETADSSDEPVVVENVQPTVEVVIESQPEEVVEENEIEENLPVVDSAAEDLSDGNLTVDEPETLETDESDIVVEENLAGEALTETKSLCQAELGCRSYSTYFSGFSMPEFDSGTFLSSAQLRLSLAAKTKDDKDRGLQRFVIDYKYSDEEAWETATTIDIEDEASNSINGGYYLVSLERSVSQAQLSNLQVRVSYEGNIEYLDKAYIESLWLEVTSAEFYEDDVSINKDDLDYERDLLAPKFLTVNDSDLDPDINKLPSFTMSYSPQQGFLKRLATAVLVRMNTQSIKCV